MTDTNQQIPDSIDWWQSPVIWKQISLAVGSIAVLFGVVLTPEQTAQIMAVLMAVSTLGVSIWTIYSRKKPCPPINPGILPKTTTKP